MKLRFAMLTVFLLLHAASFLAIGQTQIIIENADALRYERKDGKEQRFLEGNVRFNQDGTLLYCDKAFFDDQKNLIDAQGHVRIIQGDSITATSNFLLYDGNTKMAQLRENVVLTDKQTVLKTPSLLFNRKSQVAYYKNSGVILDGKNTLKSKKGSYYTTSKVFYFKKNVALVNEEYSMYSDTLQYNSLTNVVSFFGPSTIYADSIRIESKRGWFDTKNNLSEFNEDPCIYYSANTFCSDTIFYNQNTGFAEALNNVSIVDTVNKLAVNGGHGDFYQHQEKAIISQEPLAKMFLGADTLFIRSDTFSLFNSTDSTVKTFLGYHNVRFYMQDLQGSCDSLSYSTRDSSLNMFYNPVMWADSNQFSANHIRALIYDNSIQKLYLEASAFIIAKEAEKRFNQISGKNMLCHFKDSEIYKVDVIGNGQAIYFPKNSEEVLIGMNKAICTDLIIYLQDKQIQRINFITKPESVLYPMDKINEEEALIKGFRWLHTIRPKDKNDIWPFVPAELPAPE